MTITDTARRQMESARERLSGGLRPVRRAWHRFWRLVSYYMPKRLYASASSPLDGTASF